MKNTYLHCNPDYFSISYEINPWMHITEQSDSDIAIKQWQEFINTLESLGIKQCFIPSEKNLPDMVFTANGGLVQGDKVVLGNFRYEERKGEEKFFKKWFKENGFEVFTTSYSFEGEGDAFIIGENLFAGYGFRSDRRVYSEINKILNIKKIIYCELINPYFYHLDTCFLPLRKDLVMLYEEAFTKGSLEEIRKNINVITISNSDAMKFVCNAVVVGDDIVVPFGCDRTYDLLDKYGFKIYPIKLDEFMKSGGAAKCMSLKLG